MIFSLFILEQRPLVHLAPRAGIMMFENNAMLELWHTPPHHVADPDEELAVRIYRQAHKYQSLRELGHIH